MSLHSKQELVVPLIMTVNKGQNSLKYDGSVMRNSLPIEMRNSSSLGLFKQNRKRWKPKRCTCRVYKDNTNGVGNVNITS